MKKIKNKRYFIIGLIFTVVAAVSLIGSLNAVQEIRFWLATLLSFTYAGINFYNAFSKKGVLDELKENVDERDIYLTMKTSHMTIQILNYLLCASVLISFVLYGLLHSQICIIVGITLCIVLLILFLIVFCINTFYENHG